MAAGVKGQDIHLFCDGRKEGVWKYEVLSQWTDLIGTFDVRLFKANKITENRMLKGLELSADEEAAVILPYSPNPNIPPDKSELTGLERLLGNIIFGLAIKGKGVVVIDNEGKPDYAQSAQNLGFSRLISGAWYIRPSIEVNVNFNRYDKRPDLKSIAGIYTFDVSLKPSWNSQEINAGEQVVYLTPVGVMFDWCKKKMYEKGLDDRSLVAGIRYDLPFMDIKLPGTGEFIINTRLETAMDYFRKVTEAIEQQGHAKGASIEIRSGYSPDYWGHWSHHAIIKLGYEHIDIIPIPNFGVHFKKFGTKPKAA